MAARKKSKLDTAVSTIQDAIRGNLSSNEAEDLVKLAIEIINHDYWDDVRGVTADILRQIKDGEITDRDQLTEAVDQGVDGTQRVIYTFQARLGLLASNNTDAYKDELGEDPPDPTAAMTMAMRADVMEQLDDAHDEVKELE